MEQKRDLHLCKVAEWEWHSERRKRSERKTSVTLCVCVEHFVHGRSLEGPIKQRPL